MKTSSLTRGITSLLLGSGIAKAIGFAVMPLLSRIYTPQEFGHLSFFVSSTTIIFPILTFRYVVALPLPKSGSDARSLLLLTLILLALTSIGVAIVCLIAIFLLPSIIRKNIEPFWLDYWWLIILGAFATALYEVVTTWATRAQQYKEISKSQIWQMISGSVTKIVAGHFGFGSLGLIFGQVMQQGGGIFKLATLTARQTAIAIKTYKSGRINKIKNKYSDFAKYKLPAHFIYSYASQAPVLLATYFIGSASTGQLGLAFQAIALPVSLISQNAGKVYYAEISKSHHGDKQEAVRITKYLALRLFWVGLFIALAAIILAPPLFPILFGKKWIEAGQLAKIMAVFIPFQFMASPLISAYNIYGNQRNVLLVHIIRSLIVTLAFYVGIKLNLGIHKIMMIYSITISIHYYLIVRDVIKKMEVQAHDQ